MPDQKPSPLVLGPKRERRESGASRRSARFGTSSAMPKKTSTTTAKIRTAPDESPTPCTSEARRTTAMTNVIVSADHDAERAPPSAGGAGREERRQDREHAGRDGGTGAGDDGEEQEQDHLEGLVMVAFTLLRAPLARGSLGSLRIGRHERCTRHLRRLGRGAGAGDRPLQRRVERPGPRLDLRDARAGHGLREPHGGRGGHRRGGPPAHRRHLRGAGPTCASAPAGSTRARG